ncbi:MAG: ATP-binding protein, partial [Pseudobdellovibrionaceae bacterium]|nr:ATP-binding protein [Pseudobdellovibrionaceae bacterium]
FVTSDLTSLYFPELGSLTYFIKYKVEYLTMLACTLSGIAFFYFNFGAYLSQKLFKLLATVFLGSIVLVAILPLHLYTQLQRPFHIMLISSLIYVLALILQAWRHRAEMVVYAFLGALILTVSFVYDILVTYRVMPFPYTMNLAMVVFIFLQSQMVAHRFAKAFRTAEHLQKELQREVERQTEEIRSIMEHVPQGIFILLPDLSIQGQYARQLEHILGYSELQGRAALPLIYNGTTLSAEQKALMESTLVASFGGSDIFWSMNDHLLPKELYRKDKNGQTQIIEAEWHPIVNKDACIARVLVTLRNVTQVRRLQEESAQHQAEMSMLIELAQVEPDVLGRFAEQSRRLLLRARELLMDSGLQPRDRSHAIFILLHTWKGNARSLSLRLLTSAIHDAEQLYVAQFKDSGEACNIENCLNQLSQLEEILDRYLRLGRDKFYPHRSKNSIPVQREDLVKIEDLLKHPATMDSNERLRGMTRHLQDFVGTHLYRSLSSILTELKEEAASLARELGKPQPDLHVDVPPVWLMQQAEENLRHAFLHMIRNSMDHGIEDTVTRVKLGKSPAGSIRIYATSKGPDLEISYEDDGKGLDLQRIDQRAKAANIISAETSRPVADLVEIIFHPGFSTTEQVSEISGRGIGMSAIRCFVTDLGGTMTMEIDQRKLKVLESVPFRIVILVPHRNCTLWTQEIAA